METEPARRRLKEKSNWRCLYHRCFQVRPCRTSVRVSLCIEAEVAGLSARMHPRFSRVDRAELFRAAIHHAAFRFDISPATKDRPIFHTRARAKVCRSRMKVCSKERKLDDQDCELFVHSREKSGDARFSRQRK